MTLDEALAEIEHMSALLEASAMLDRDKDAEIERLRAGQTNTLPCPMHPLKPAHPRCDAACHFICLSEIHIALEAAEARAAAMKERCARVAEEFALDLMHYTRGNGSYLDASIADRSYLAHTIATAIRNLPDADGDGNATRAET